LHWEHDRRIDCWTSVCLCRRQCYSGSLQVSMCVVAHYRPLYICLYCFNLFMCPILFCFPV